MLYSLLDEYCTEAYHTEVEDGCKYLCDMFDHVNIPMRNDTWCEVMLYEKTMIITSSSASPIHPGIRYCFIFHEDRVIAERNTSNTAERFEIPYNSTEESLFQLSTVHELYGLDMNIIDTMKTIRDMYVSEPVNPSVND